MTFNQYNRMDNENEKFFEDANGKVRVRAGSIIYDASGNPITSSNPLPTQLFDSSGSEAKIDDMTNTLQNINFEHHKIHEGNHYFVCNFETLNDGEAARFAVTTPNTTKWLHMNFNVEGTSRTEFKVYENSTVNGGTSTTPINNNRNSVNTSDSIIVKNPIITVTGDTIYVQSKGLEGATPSKSENEGVVNRDREIILKQDATYIFEITSKDDNNIVSYCGEWYEHVNEN